MSFESLAETPQGVLRDMASYMAHNFQREDRVSASLGINKPLLDADPADGNALVDTVYGWFSDHAVRQGGIALDTPTTPAGQTWRDRRRNALAAEEGTREWAYDDRTGRRVGTAGAVQGNVTVGIGFNMDRGDGPQVFQRLYGNDVSFDDVRNGRARLTRAQIDRLFDFNLDEAENIVNTRFRGVDLPEHKRLALISMAFNGPALLNRTLVDLVRSGRDEDAARHIENASNRQPVLRGRRAREARMFRGALI